MDKPPPSQIRVVSYEPLTAHQIRIHMEMVVDVHRLTELGQEFIAESLSQMGLKDSKGP